MDFDFEVAEAQAKDNLSILIRESFESKRVHKQIPNSRLIQKG
jgi:hypothetical protein